SLLCSHSQLSYIAALRSHREQVTGALILDLMSWCQHTLTGVLLQEQALDTYNNDHKLAVIHCVSVLEHLSAHLLLVLKQISLLLEILPELLKLRHELLVAEIK